jgi:glycosyltransferase involved in cell wall biosynthesis
MFNSKISVVIPIYNVEKYLEKCLISIVNQTYSNIQIILVNDGSTDTSLTICENYEKVDSRIMIINKNNGGLSSARNVGIKHSTGDFITFIDSDDYISKNYIMNLLKTMHHTNSDIAISNFALVYETVKQSEERENLNNTYIKYNAEEALKELFLQKKFDNSAWGKLYKIELFENISYPEGKLYEDLPITYRLIMKSESIGYTNTNDYFYLQRNNSIQNMKFNEQKLDVILFVDQMVQDIKRVFPSLEKYVKIRAFCAIFNLWKQIPKNSHKKREIWLVLNAYKCKIVDMKEARTKIKVLNIIIRFGYSLNAMIFNPSYTRKR